MRKLVFAAVLALLVALPGTVLPRNERMTASPAGSESSQSAGKVIRSCVGRTVALEALTIRDGIPAVQYHRGPTSMHFSWVRR